jgi:Tol biopolymer transport system component
LTDDLHKDRLPRWSPDGKRLAFYSDRSGRYEIWTINADGSGLQQMTFTSGPGVVYPVWSPDGGRLAYSLYGGRAFIMDLGRAWSAQTPMAPPLISPNHHFVAWSWSPDGKWLAGWPGHSDVDPLNGVFLFSLADQRFERVTDFGEAPKWLSDSRRLLFRHQGKLFLVDSATKRVHEVLSIPEDIQGHHLSRDNRSLYLGVATTEADIWLMTMDR